MNLECYTGLYYIHFTIAIIGIIIFLLFSTLFTTLYIDLNPYSAFPFAGPETKLNLILMFMKCFIPLWFIVFYDGSKDMIFLFIMLVVYALLLYIRIRSREAYNKGVA